MGSHKEPVSEVGFARREERTRVVRPRRDRCWLMTIRRLVAAVDSLRRGVGRAGGRPGRPSWARRPIIWLYGFMTGVRSARRLETAGREQLALQWLSGYQQPDHNTLWPRAPQPAARAAAPHGPDRGAAGPGRLGAASTGRAQRRRRGPRAPRLLERGAGDRGPGGAERGRRRRRRGCRLTWPKRSGCARRFWRPARRWRRASADTST